MFLIFWGTGVACLMYYKNHSVIFDNSLIEVTNVFGKANEIRWSDISGIKFNAISGLLVLCTDVEAVKVHQHGGLVKIH